MPQQNTARAKQIRTGGPPTAEQVEQWLFGLGQFSLQLDNYRLTAPSPVRQRLGPLCGQEFVFSFWDGARLRIIPKTLWIPYLNCLCAGIKDPAKAKDLVSRLSRGCATRRLDRHNRWDLPVNLAKQAGLGCRNNAVMLLPCRFWLEAVSLETWEAFLSETFQCIRGATMV